MKLSLVLIGLFGATIFSGCGGNNPVENTAPVATPQSVALNEDTTKAITLAGTDADGNALTYAVTSAPSHGTFASGVYTPTANYTGSDNFSFTANDGTADSAPATVSITVNPVSDTPIANAGNDLSAKDNDNVSLDGSASSDIDGDTLSFSWVIVSTPLNSNATLKDANTSTAVLSTDKTGEYRIELTVSDGSTNSTDEVTVNAKMFRKVSSEYDSNGDGTANRITTYTYDTSGNKLTYSYDNNGDGTADEIGTYTYDTNGNRLTLSYDKDGDGTVYEITTYTWIEI